MVAGSAGTAAAAAAAVEDNDAATNTDDNTDKDIGWKADNLIVTFASHIQLEAHRTQSVEEMLLLWRNEKIFPCLEGMLPSIQNSR